MRRRLLSPHWYRVAGLRPRLRDHVETHRHVVRGVRWYVLQDHARGEVHRFSWGAQALVGQMNGRRTLGEIWERAGRRLGDELPTQDEVVDLVARMHASDLVQLDVTPAFAELARRQEKHERARWQQIIRNPMSLRVPLFDPDRILDAGVGSGVPGLGKAAVLSWVALVVTALAVAGLHAPELAVHISDRLFSFDNLVVVLLVYPFLKALHEIGHALAAKALGGEVHETGIMLAVFMPLLYVDASCATAFANRYHRIAVAGAGIMVETGVAALALFVWVSVEPGYVRDLAFATMSIAGISTVMFNANPLLRYDGYYILADLIAVPNLASRAGRYLAFLVKRYAFGVRDAVSPVAAPGEAGWLATYGVSSAIYRIAFGCSIAMVIASHYFVFGVVLAIWFAAAFLVLPVLAGLKHLVTSPELLGHRGRAFAVTATAAACVVGSLGIVPLPYGTVAKGVIWAGENSVVHAGTEGFVQEVVAAPGTLVARGDVLLRLGDPLIAAELEVGRAETLEAERKLAAVDTGDAMEGLLAQERLSVARGKEARLRERAAELEIRSPSSGIFMIARDEDRPGRFVHRSESIAYVVDPTRAVARILVSQADIDIVRSRLNDTRIRLTEDIWTERVGEVERIEPAATFSLPSPALATSAGGDVATDAQDPKRTREGVFAIDVAFPAGPGPSRIGERVLARFDHGHEPLIWRLYRAGRQLFLRQLNV